MPKANYNMDHFYQIIYLVGSNNMVKLKSNGIPRALEQDL